MSKICDKSVFVIFRPININYCHSRGCNLEYNLHSVFSQRPCSPDTYFALQYYSRLHYFALYFACFLSLKRIGSLVNEDDDFHNLWNAVKSFTGDLWGAGQVPLQGPWGTMGQGWVRFSGHALYLSSAVTGSALRPALGLDSLHFVSDRGSIVGTKILTNPHCFLVATTSAQLSCLWSRLRGGYFRGRYPNLFKGSI